jgi:TolA-binding protein
VLLVVLVLAPQKKYAPAYTRALARIKSGQYADAEMEVIRQLERSEHDFEGWLMLARIYAVHFGDMKEAERTVREICGQKEIGRKEYCTALLSLGDWYLTAGHNSPEAYRIWAEVCDKFPMSDFATTARQKIRQLGE